MLILSYYRDMTVRGMAHDENVHIDFWPTPEEPVVGAKGFIQPLGYLSITPGQARKLSAELIVASDKAENYAA